MTLFSVDDAFATIREVLHDADLVIGGHPRLWDAQEALDGLERNHHGLVVLIKELSNSRDRHRQRRESGV